MDIGTPAVCWVCLNIRNPLYALPEAGNPWARCCDGCWHTRALQQLGQRLHEEDFFLLYANQEYRRLYTLLRARVQQRINLGEIPPCEGKIGPLNGLVPPDAGEEAPPDDEGPRLVRPSDEASAAIMSLRPPSQHHTQQPQQPPNREMMEFRQRLRDAATVEEIDQFERDIFERHRWSSTNSPGAAGALPATPLEPRHAATDLGSPRWLAATDLRFQDSPAPILAGLAQRAVRTGPAGVPQYFVRPGPYIRGEDSPISSDLYGPQSSGSSP